MLGKTGEVDHFRRVSGMVATWGVVPDMICRTQAPVSLSSAEDEFHEMTSATASTLFYRTIQEWFGIQTTVRLFVDARTAKNTSERDVQV